jgi:hypothetical protein
MSSKLCRSTLYIVSFLVQTSFLYPAGFVAISKTNKRTIMCCWLFLALKMLRELPYGLCSLFVFIRKVIFFTLCRLPRRDSDLTIYPIQSFAHVFNVSFSSSLVSNVSVA